MAEWITGLEGTEAGKTLAMALALFAAVVHALFGAIQKGPRLDPWESRAAIDIFYGVLALPLVLFVVPFPEPHMWPIFAGVFLVHTGYKLSQASAYSAGAYTVVYPVVRGTGPFFTIIGAWFLFEEVFTPVQWLGVFVLMAGILGLAAYNLVFQEVQRATLRRALALAVLTGLFVAGYTTWDAYGIRATTDPFTFIAWFFLIDAFFMPVYVALVRRPAVRVGDWVRLGLPGAVLAYLSFGSILLATRLDKVGEAAVLRETSTVFAAGIAWVMFGEKVGPRRLTLMALIAAGAVIVEVGG